MQWELVIALVIAVPIILFPVAFVWYLNAGGIYAAVRRALARRAEKQALAGEETQTQPVEIKS